MWFWFGFAVLALIGEVMTGTFYLLLFALGLGAAGLASLMGAALAWQIVTVALITAAGLAGLRKAGVLKKHEINAARNQNVNLDIGQIVDVQSWDDNNTARVWYRGAYWQVGLMPGANKQAGQHCIVEIQGSTLIVEPSIPTH